MQALIVVDVQNEFSPAGQRPVPNHATALAAVQQYAADARREGRPIAWVRHHNRPDEGPAFQPDTWGAELSPGLGPMEGAGPERLFTKQVYGAFGGTGLEEWLRGAGVDGVLIVGFYAHMCVSTSVREAIVRGFEVAVDPVATGACDLQHELLGRQTADEVRRAAMLHVMHMGARIVSGVEAAAA